MDGFFFSQSQRNSFRRSYFKSKNQREIRKKSDHIAQVLANKKAKAEKKTFAKENKNQKKK